MSGIESSRKSSLSEQQPRIKFQRERGFALYADVNARVMREIAPMTPLRLPESWLEWASFPARGEHHPIRELTRNYGTRLSQDPTSSLYLTQAHLLQLFEKQFNGLPGRPHRHFNDRNDISEGDLRVAEAYTHKHGFAEMDFPWHFSAGVAGALAEQFLGEGHITLQQFDEISLEDWAEMIGSAWFGKLIHDLAFTRNSIYKDFGYKSEHYNMSAFMNQLKDSVLTWYGHELPFVVGHQIVPETQRKYLTANLNPNLRNALRKELQYTWTNGNESTASSGCPAGRYKAVLSHSVAIDPHVKSLINSGVARVDESRSNDDKTTVVQDFSAIDISLDVFATQLERYGRRYGDPVVIRYRDEPVESREYRKNRIEHRRKPYSGAFVEDL